MRSYDSLLKEYVRKLEDDDVKYLYYRYASRLSGDMAEITEKVSQHQHMDRWLQGANGAVELFDLLDYLGDFVVKEHISRSNA